MNIRPFLLIYAISATWMALMAALMVPGGLPELVIYAASAALIPWAAGMVAFMASRGRLQWGLFVASVVSIMAILGNIGPLQA